MLDAAQTALAVQILPSALLVEQLFDVWTTQTFLKGGLVYNRDIGKVEASPGQTSVITEGDPLARPFVKNWYTNLAAALAINAIVRVILHSATGSTLVFLGAVNLAAIAVYIPTLLSNWRVVQAQAKYKASNPTP